MTSAGTTLAGLAWPLERAEEAIAALARQAGIRVPSGIPAHGRAPALAEAEAPGDELDRWIVRAADRAGLEVEPVVVPYAEVDVAIERVGPALALKTMDGKPELLALLRVRRERALVVRPDGTRREVAVAAIRDAVTHAIEDEARADVDAVISGAGIDNARRDRARRAINAQLLGERRVGAIWLLRASPAGSIRAALREARLGGLLATTLVAHAIQFSLWILSWAFLGRGALAGRLETGWLTAWALVLASLVPLRLVALSAAGRLAIHAGAFLRRRLLVGALGLSHDGLRARGFGQLLGRVLEADVVEQMAITGGFLALTAAVEIVLAAIVLALGAAGWLHVVVLFGWVVITAWLAQRQYRARRAWTEERLARTNALVESLAGHRTRLVQEAGQDWNVGEDPALERTHELGLNLDRWTVRLVGLVPRGWFLVGILVLAPGFVADGTRLTSVAIAVGGVILAYQAFRHLADGLERIAAARDALHRVVSILRAASPASVGAGLDLEARQGRESRDESEVGAATMDREKPREVVLVAEDLHFTREERKQTILDGVTLRLRSGERALLEGPSGGGKSTLASILAVQRAPAAGLLLCRGLDPPTLGTDEWRRRIVLVPQFHDNHVFLGSLAFNLLLGYRWPPTPADLKKAECVCRALGLGPLMDGMPMGLQQPVGETGWQLSHGERSRIFIARGLLQRPDVLILDESFAALDPQTLRRTVEHVLASPSAVVAIAHP